MCEDIILLSKFTSQKFKKSNLMIWLQSQNLNLVLDDC